MLVDTRRESNVLSGAVACIDMDAEGVSVGRRGDQAGRGGSDEDAEEDSGADDAGVDV
jgi:hypothetical protein